MKLFSERYGWKKGREVIQLHRMDEKLRIALFNFFYEQFMKNWGVYNFGQFKPGVGYETARSIWKDFWYKPLDSFPSERYPFMDNLKQWMLEAPWYEVYDFLEFVMNKTSLSLRINSKELNQILEREMAGYRLEAGKVIPVSDATELKTIEESLSLPEKFSGARRHIEDALEKLSQRPTPDFRNAIKEAISAVESAARVVTGKEKATLSDALKVLEKKGKLHPALKRAWEKLYGYTCDEGGIRHAMVEEPNIDFATAKYMVVSCAAFVNFLSMFELSESR